MHSVKPLLIGFRHRMILHFSLESITLDSPCGDCAVLTSGFFFFTANADCKVSKREWFLVGGSFDILFVRWKTGSITDKRVIHFTRHLKRCYRCLFLGWKSVDGSCYATLFGRYKTDRVIDKDIILHLLGWRRVIYRCEIVVNVVVKNPFLGRLDELENCALNDLLNSYYQCEDKGGERHFLGFLERWDEGHLNTLFRESLVEIVGR